jgi:hypothetical protein
MNKTTIGERVFGALSTFVFIAFLLWVAWVWIWRQEWAAPKPFATVDKDFKIGNQYQTLEACTKTATDDAQMFGSDSEVMAVPKGCVNLAEDPKRLVFTTPYVPSDWHLTFEHPRSDPYDPYSVEIVGHFPTLRDCLLAALPLIPSDKRTMREAGFDCEYGPAQEGKP